MKIIKLISESDNTMVTMYRTNAPIKTIKSIAKMAIKAYNMGASTYEHEFEIMRSLMVSIGWKMIQIPYSKCSEFNNEAFSIVFS